MEIMLFGRGNGPVGKHVHCSCGLPTYTHGVLCGPTVANGVILTSGSHLAWRVSEQTGFYQFDKTCFSKGNPCKLITRSTICSTHALTLVYMEGTHAYHSKCQSMPLPAHLASTPHSHTTRSPTDPRLNHCHSHCHSHSPLHRLAAQAWASQY